MRNTLYAILLLMAPCWFCGCARKSESAPDWPDGAWQRHTIDDASLGADGTRFADINGDGRLDITTPWEQGGRVRVYIHPGETRLRQRWPAVTVGEVGDPEDSFFVDLDDDGFMDVVSSCEGATRAIFVHWSPTDPDRLLDPQAWKTEELPPASGLEKWMYGFSMQVDGKAGIDLIAGGKSGHLGWFESPANPRDLKSWRWHPLLETRWPMTLHPNDMDRDGDLDIVVTERLGANRGALWLENPGPDKAGSAWREHRIGPVNDHEALHHTITDLDGDGLEDILVAVKGGPIRFHRRVSHFPLTWETHSIEMPPYSGGGKAVEVGDIDLDGQLDLAVSCEHAVNGKIGTFWISCDGSPAEGRWKPTSISGPEGFINDLIQLTDLDGDGDLDVVTVEEKGPYLAAGYKGKELGVIWYENPVR